MARSSLALLFDRPQPVGFLDKQVGFGRRRHQLGTFLAEVIEATAQLAPGQRVLIVRPVGNCRREALKHAPQPDGGSEVTASARLRRSAHHADGVANYQPGFTDGLAVAVPCRRERCGDERKDMRRGDRVEVFMANDFEPVADHGVKRFAGMHEFDGKLHRFALHAASDRLLQSRG
jgi:hypothetical protein